MKRIILALILVALITSFSYCQEIEQPLKLTIKSDKQVYEAGESITVNVEIKNNSNKDIWIVLPQDGSERKFRYPHCLFEVRNSSGELVQDSRIGCKTTNPLKLDGFYNIKSGETFRLYKEGYRLETFICHLTPDVYSITFHYSTDAKKESEWHGLYSDDYWNNRNKNEFWRNIADEIKKVKSMLRKVPRLTLTSNIITIETKE